MAESTMNVLELRSYVTYSTHLHRNGRRIIGSSATQLLAYNKKVEIKRIVSALGHGTVGKGSFTLSRVMTLAGTTLGWESHFLRQKVAGTKGGGFKRERNGIWFREIGMAILF